jgi:hypothetical protein
MIIFELQSGDNDEVSSADNTFDNKAWETIFTSDTRDNILSYVLMSLNNGINIDTDNCCFRLVDNMNKEVITF